MVNNRSAALKGSIQIVDDSPENLDTLVSILSKNGYETRTALDGEMALTSVKTDPPDLILMDILMPDMSGFEVCRQLKADKRTRGIPVLYISALHDTQSKIGAFKAGGVDYITKPFQESEVLARVYTHLEIKSAHNALQKALQAIEQAHALLKAAWQGIPDGGYRGRSRPECDRFQPQPGGGPR